MCLFLYLSLAGGHGLGDQTLERQLLLLELLGGRILNLQSGHGLTDLGLDLVLLAALQLQGQSGVGDDLLDVTDVVLQALLGLEALAEGLVVALELLGVYNKTS